MAPGRAARTTNGALRFLPDFDENAGGEEAGASKASQTVMQTRPPRAWNPRTEGLRGPGLSQLEQEPMHRRWQPQCGYVPAPAKAKSRRQTCIRLLMWTDEDSAPRISIAARSAGRSLSQSQSPDRPCSFRPGAVRQADDRGIMRASQFVDAEGLLCPCTFFIPSSRPAVRTADSSASDSSALPS
jgi:hypothetical protein